MSFVQQLNEMAKKSDYSKIRSLRKKAALYLLNSKFTYNKWQKEINTGTSSQIRNFLRNEFQDSVLNKHYQCDQCCISFKLGTELRQHLRTHIFRKKSCVI